MSQINNHPETRSVAFTFLFETLEQIGQQIEGAVNSNYFTEEQLDFIVLTCHQFKKLVSLRHRNQFINNLLTLGFAEFFGSSTDAPVQQPTNELGFICHVCEGNVPILNNDLNYSVQVHNSSSDHLEFVSALQAIEEFRSEVANSENSVTEPAGGNEAMCYCELCDVHLTSESDFLLHVKGKKHRIKEALQKSDSDFIVHKKDGTRYCNLCDVKIPGMPQFESHINGSMHKQKIKSAASTKEPTQKTATDFFVYKNGTRYCDLCDVKIPGIHQFESHINGSGHKQKLKSIISTKERTEKPASDFIVYKDGIRYCDLYDVKIPETLQFESHINGSRHKKKMKSAGSTKEPTEKPASDFIVYKDGTRSCDVEIPGTPQFESHINGSGHKQKLKSIISTKERTEKPASDFIVYKDGIRYCDLCDVKIPGTLQFESHINGSRHKQKMKSAASTKEPTEKPASDFIVYKDGTRSCDVEIPGTPQFESHINGSGHKQKVKSDTTIKKPTEKTASDLIVYKDGPQYWDFLFNIKIPGTSQFESHINGSGHEQKMKSAASTEELVEKTASDFIVYKNGTRYCDLCDVSLPGMLQFRCHIKGSTHQENLESAATIQKIVESFAFDDFIVSTGSEWYKCHLCDVQFHEEFLDSHKNGYKHKTNLKNPIYTI